MAAIVQRVRATAYESIPRAANIHAAAKRWATRWRETATQATTRNCGQASAVRSTFVIGPIQEGCTRVIVNWKPISRVQRTNALSNTGSSCSARSKARPAVVRGALCGCGSCIVEVSATPSPDLSTPRLDASFRCQCMAVAPIPVRIDGAPHETTAYSRPHMTRTFRSAARAWRSLGRRAT